MIQHYNIIPQGVVRSTISEINRKIDSIAETQSLLYNMIVKKKNREVSKMHSIVHLSLYSLFLRATLSQMKTHIQIHQLKKYMYNAQLHVHICMHACIYMYVHVYMYVYVLRRIMHFTPYRTTGVLQQQKSER